MQSSLIEGNVVSRKFYFFNEFSIFYADPNVHEEGKLAVMETLKKGGGGEI